MPILVGAVQDSEPHPGRRNRQEYLAYFVGVFNSRSQDRQRKRLTRPGPPVNLASMRNILNLRNEQGLSQADLVGPCGTSRQCLSDIENGHHLPTPELAAALRIKLKNDGISDSSQVLSPRRIQALARLRPFDLPSVDQEPWLRMLKAYPRQVARLRVSPFMMSWMRENLLAETGVEGLRLCCWASRGAKGIFANPHHLGYRSSCLLDSHGQALGERLLPALHWVHSEFESILWPQPRLLGSYGTFRPDGLLFTKAAGGRFWRAEEVDGAVHDGAQRRAWDLERERLVGLDFIRFTAQQVLSLEYSRLIAATLGQMRSCA